MNGTDPHAAVRTGEPTPSVKVLLVEANKHDADVVMAALAQPPVGFDVDWVNSLPAGRSAVVAARYDCLIVDLELPGAGGLAVIDALRAQATDAAIVVITRRSADDLGVQAIRQGADDYLLKAEISTTRLRRAVDHAVERKRSQAAARDTARDTAQRSASVLGALAEGVMVLDAAGRFVSVNSAAEELLQVSATELLGHHVATAPLSVVNRDGTPRSAESLPSVPTLESGQPLIGAILGIQHPGGAVVWVDVNTTPLLSTEGLPDGAVISIRDVSLRVDAEEGERFQSALLADAEKAARALASIVESTADAVFTKSLQGTILTWNRGAEQLYGFTAEDVIGRHVSLLHPRSVGNEVESILAVIAAGETVRGLETVRRRRDGAHVEVSLTVSPIFDADGSVLSASVIAHDIRDRCRLERELVRQAMSDALTGLPNRTLLGDRLAQAIAATGRRGTSVAVLVLDLDRFKTINDSSGHLTGDGVLVEVARRLRDLVRPADTVARLRGDEFVIVCEDTDEAGAEQVASHIAEVLREPFNIADQHVYVTASIGIAVAPPLQADGETLLRNADAAMYDAKAHGRAWSRVFDVSMAQRSDERLELTTELRDALAGGELELHYQPIIELASGNVVGLETLARWHHPTRGWVSPAVFVLLAEDGGFAAALARWVLGQACRDGATLRASGVLPTEARLAVNISPRGIADPALVQTVRDAAAKARFPLDALELEVTETGLLIDPPTAHAVLSVLREFGVGVALDDFGTGYSSLTNIRELPVTTIKIDRTFVQHIVSRPDDLAVTTSVIELARAIGLRTIAEGVETPEQVTVLRRLGCLAGQGHLWSRALPRAELADLLRRDSGALLAVDPSLKVAPKVGPGVAVTNEHGRHRIFVLRRDGGSTTTIAAALNSEGYKTPLGMRWHTNSVARAIRDLETSGAGSDS